MSKLFSSRKDRQQTAAIISRALSASQMRAQDTSANALRRTRYDYKAMRHAARKDIWCECVILSDDGPLQAGVIIDISKTGARVRFRGRPRFPDTIRIRAIRLGLNRTANIVWQRDFDVGLAFSPHPASTQPTDTKKFGTLSNAQP